MCQRHITSTAVSFLDEPIPMPGVFSGVPQTNYISSSGFTCARMMWHCVICWSNQPPS